MLSSKDDISFRHELGSAHVKFDRLNQQSNLISTFFILKATSTGRQTRRLRIFNISASVWHQIDHARDS